MEPVVSHIEITVRDMAVAVPFYDKLLPMLGYDLALRSSVVLAEHDKHVVSYEHPRLGVAIASPRRELAHEPVHRRRPGSLHHLAFEVATRAEVDRMHDELRASHSHYTEFGLMPSAIESMPDIEHQLFMVREPGGYEIAIYSSHASGEPV